MRINGRPILTKPNIAVTMTLVLHELAINAAKHGALTAAGGRVSVGNQEAYHHLVRRGGRSRCALIQKNRSSGTEVTRGIP